jgi:signal transduction histidine kinase
MPTLTSDFRYALRALRASPSFTLVALASLTLGIGANTTIFSIANGLLFSHLPVPHPDQLARVVRGSHSPPDYTDLRYIREHATTIAAVIGEHITVEEEIQLIQSFVSVEQMRFPDKFDITYDISDEINEYQIIKIVLQPIVENAIKHGVANKRGKGHIAVSGLKEGDTLEFKVEDDGIGFDINTINTVGSHNSMPRTGYGLMNVDERIKLEYGQEFGLRIESQIGIGTKVGVSLKISN